MRGEEKIWFKLAKKIGGCTVEELKDRMLYTEFIRWCEELREEQNERDEKDWQIAVVAYEVYLLRHVVSHLFAKSLPKPQHEIKDFLVSFKAPGKDVGKKTLAEMEAAAMVKSGSAYKFLKAALAPKDNKKVKRNGSGTPRRKTNR